LHQKIADGRRLDDPVSSTARTHVSAVRRRTTPVRPRLGLDSLVLNLARPYRGWLAIILSRWWSRHSAALAAPWPLKIVIDYAIGHEALPALMERVGTASLLHDGRTLATVAALTMVLAAVIGGFASYIDSYYTESVGQSVANDLRMRVYDHLERLSFNYYEPTRRRAAQHGDRRPSPRSGLSCPLRR